MDVHPQFVKEFQLSLAEMEWTMKHLGASDLIGIKMGDLKPDLARQGEKEIIQSLLQKGILLPDENQGFAWDAQARAILDAVLVPEQALIVFRDKKGEGRRFFRVLRKGKILALHSFPSDREHRIGLFRQPEDILRLLLTWFPFYTLPYAAVKFQIEKNSFDNFRALAIEGKKDQALRAFNLKDVDSAQKIIFLRCLRDAALSGSVARVKIQDGHPREGESVAFLTDGKAGWMITHEKSANPKNPLLIIQRIGVDFAGVLRAQIESFSGSKLPRRETDPASNTLRFALTSNELAAALAAVNCRDLSMKLYAGESKDVTGEYYTKRMVMAQQSLVDAGLCTLSDSGLPILADDLAHAVLPIGASDSMVQIVQSKGGPSEDMGVYLIRGRMFTAYFNYGEHLQILVQGKYKDVESFIQSLFPEFGIGEKRKKVDARLSLEILGKIIHETKSLEEAIALLVSDGMDDAAARTFAEDVSDALYHATLSRRNMPDRKMHGEENVDKRQPLSLFLLKSPRNSWLIQFHDLNTRGKAALADRDIFRRALVEMII